MPLEVERERSVRREGAESMIGKASGGGGGVVNVWLDRQWGGGEDPVKEEGAVATP